jgi:hypothetical protein
MSVFWPDKIEKPLEEAALKAPQLMAGLVSLVAELNGLVIDARAELAELKALRERMQAVVGAEKR